MALMAIFAIIGFFAVLAWVISVVGIGGFILLLIGFLAGLFFAAALGA